MKKTLTILVCILVLGLSKSAFAGISIGSTLPGPALGDLVGHWTFDGKHTNWVTQRIADASGTGNTGTLVNTSTTTSPVEGRIGQAIKLDGVNDYVSVGANLGFTGDVNVAVSAWLYMTGSNNGNFPAVVDFQSQGGNCTGLYFTIKDNKPSIDFGGNRWRATSALLQNRWYHVVVTKTPGLISETSKIYVNGAEVAGAVENGDCTPNVSTPGAGGLVIGRLTHTAAYMSGSIDDVRIYDRALTAAEVAKLYGQPLSSGIKQGASVSPGSLSTGLVGHWTFDGSKLIQNVSDSSGQGNPGYFSGFGATSTAVTEGRIGQALKFDGVNDWIGVTATDDFDVTETQGVTMVAWIKTSTNSTIITSRFDSAAPAPYHRIIVGGDATAQKAGFGVRGSVSGEITTSGVTTVTDGKWHQVVGVRDVVQDKIFIYVDGVQENSRSDTTVGDFAVTSPVIIGAHGISGGSSQWFNGSIDDVRIYNRALSQAEIATLYRQGGGTKTGVSTSPANLATGLVGHWTFDGSKLIRNVADSSTQGNHGALKGVVATSTAVTEGKIGQALKFDGTTGYVQATEIVVTTAVTGSAWFKTATNNRVILGNDIASSRTATQLYIDTSNHVRYGSDNGGFISCTGVTNVTDSKWHLASVVYGGGTIKGYLDGVQDCTGNESGSIGTANDAMYIGASGISSGASPPYSFFLGLIDDVRIYNRALSASEIMTLYKNGK